MRGNVKFASVLLTEYIMAINVISQFIFQELRLASNSKQIGVDMRVPVKLYKKTTINSAGYCFIILV